MRFARRELVADAALIDAIDRAERGLVDAQLGGGVIKQRVARAGQGRSGGYRTLVAWWSGTRAVFVLGFAKNDRDNIEDHELRALRRAAGEMLSWNDGQVDAMLESGAWTEIDSNGN